MKKGKILLATLALAAWATSEMTMASPNGGPLGDFEAHADVGSPKIAGYATWNAASQVYTLSAGGANIWAKRDEFQFAYRRMKGDFIVQAQVEFQGKGVDPHRKAGIMVRTSTADFDSAYVDGALHGDGLTSLQYRKAKGEDTAQIEMPAAKGANVIQLERRGNVFIFSAARFGEPFEVAEIKDVPNVPEEAFVGLFLSSHNADVQEKVVFRHVRVIKPVKVGFQPYRDYIGSRLEVMNVTSGHRNVYYTSRVPFEAPNWLPDGSALHLQRQRRRSGHARAAVEVRPRHAHADADRHRLRDPQQQRPRVVVRRHAARDQRPEHRRPASRPSSRCRRAAACRSASHRTRRSYMHGWTPDAKWLIYTGGRKPKGATADEYDIYKIASDGSGKEINLTNSAGLDDGPEVSPDGKKIYFNSTRSGQMQIWRMDLDGKNQERVTNDHKFNDWFPHFSPDGKWIVIISYGLDVEPSNHPYYKHCYLRIMPADGSAPPKVIGVRVRRPGHDQRAVVVAGWHAHRVREQQRRVVALKAGIGFVRGACGDVRAECLRRSRVSAPAAFARSRRRARAVWRADWRLHNQYFR